MKRKTRAKLLSKFDRDSATTRQLAVFVVLLSAIGIETRAKYKIRNARRGATQCSAYRFLEIINCPR